jgi:hypothetical protein
MSWIASNGLARYIGSIASLASGGIALDQNEASPPLSVCQRNQHQFDALLGQGFDATNHLQMFRPVTLRTWRNYRVGRRSSSRRPTVEGTMRKALVVASLTSIALLMSISAVDAVKILLAVAAGN